MGTLQFKNNASTTLSGSINDSQTSITVTSGGAFPSLAAGDYFYATMYEVSSEVEINIEIVKVTETVGNLWTVVRAQDGTTARSRNGVTTCYIELRLTAAGAALMVQKDNNLSDLSSAATARTNLGLGSIATQAANNVSITGGSISGVTLTSLDSGTTIQDNADPTKQLRFEVSGIAAGTTRTLTAPNASGVLALTSDLTSGYQPLDSDLTAVAGLSANGLIARTGAGAMAIRAITQPAAGITVTNGDGVSGNPTLALANDLLGVEALNTTGFVRRTAADTWSASALVDGDLPSALTGKTYNALTLTPNATGFSLAGGTTSKTLTVNNSITLAGTDGTTITLPTITGTVALNNQTFFIGTTSVAINRASASLSLTGVNIDGSAGSATTATTATHLAGGAANRIAYQSAAATTAFLDAPTTTDTYLRWNGSAFVWSAVSGATGGTVTSVGVSSSDLTVTGSPITGSGSISLALNTVPISKGGTGQITALAAFDALSPATTLGDLIYSDGTDNVRLPGNTVASRRFLRQTGTGTVSAAPAWDALVDGDIPSALTGKTYNALTLTAASVGFTIAGGTTSKTLTVSNTLTLAGTDSSTLNIGAGGTLGSAAFTASGDYAPAAGSTSVVTLGTVTAGTWQGSAIGISYGGTGSTSKAAGFNALSPVTTLGDLIYGDGANSNARLAGHTGASKRFLTQTGTGSVSAAPGWEAIVDGDLPSSLTGKTYNGLTLTANATGFQIAGGTTSKTLAVSNNLTLSGTDGSALNIGAGGTLGTGAFATIANYAPIASPTFSGSVKIRSGGNYDASELTVVNSPGGITASFQNYNNTSSGCVITIDKSRGGSGSPTIPNSSDTLGTLTYRGFISTGGFVDAIRLVTTRLGGGSSSGVGARFDIQGFVATAGGGSMGDRFTIRHTGSVQFGISDVYEDTLASSWTNPAKLYVGNGTYRDAITAASGTIEHGTTVSIASTAFWAVNSNVTYTNASTLYVAGAPTAVSSTSITNPYAVFVNGGKSYFGGNVGIGVNPGYRLHVKGSGSTSATYSFAANNSSDTNIIACRDDGYVTIPYAYNTTTASAANVFVDGNGGLIRSTSSLKYKTDVQNATHGLAKVMQLRSVTYKGKSSFDGTKVFGGLIAEEVHALGLTEFVDYNANGEPDALHYGHMVALLAKAIQEQQALITALTDRVAALEV